MATKQDNNKPFSATQLGSIQLAAQNRDIAGLKRNEDPNWVFSDIDPKRWNQSFPYQLLVVSKDGDGIYTIQSTFTLPIPPESLSISTPFAIVSSVTVGGIVEEHNGAPIRNITLSGTTGVLPLKGSATQLKDATLPQAIFAGTINAFTKTASAVGSLVGKSQESPNLVSDSDIANIDGSAGFTASPGITSGYYQFRLLQQYLEDYITLKKTLKGRDARLAFAMWKDQAVYLCTPTGFNVSRSAGQPLEYQYNLTFRAWKRIHINKATGDQAFDAFRSTPRNPNLLAKMLNKLTEARTVLQDARQTVLAVRGDVDHVLFEPLRSVILFVKDGIGVSLALVDLPDNIIKDLKSTVVEAITLKHGIDGLGAEFSARGQAAVDDFNSIKNLSVSTGKSDTINGEPVISFANALSNRADPANKIFENPQDHPEFFSALNVGDIKPSPTLARKIVLERQRARNQTRLDFEKARDVIVQVLADFSDAVGAGNARYDATFGRTPKPQNRTPTQLDFDVMFSLNNVIMEFNRLAATGDTDRFTINSIDVVAGLARQSGIAFTVPKGKFAVPFPYGSTLEKLSNRYLGDPNRWMEIAALNGLREPYVDEEGFDLPILTNGAGNQIIVSTSDDLFINQTVWISSNDTSRTKRRIVNLEKLSSTQTTVTVDGDADLSRFHLLAQPTLHAFLPDTVNSQQLIYIPSDRESTLQDNKTKSIPGIDEFDQLINVGGIDLLLTQSSDLAITPDGDCRLAIGLTNIVQKVKVTLETPQGTLLQHPNFGLKSAVGVSTADVSAQELLTSARDLFRDDSTFTGVTGVSVLKQGPVASITMAVGIRGSDQVIPITVQVTK